MRKKISLGEWFSYFKINFLLDYAIELGVFLIGFLIAIFAFGTGDATKMFPLGVCGALGAIAVTVIFTSIMSFSQQFNVAVTMGCTRKSFLGAYLGTTTVFMIVEFFTAYLLYQLERLVYTAAFPAKEFVDGPEMFFRPGILIFCLIATIVIKFFSGMLVLRFGRMGFFVLWIGYMALCLGFSSICAKASHEPNGYCARFLDALIGVFKSFNGLGIYFLGYAILIILFVVFAVLQLRQEVRTL